MAWQHHSLTLLVPVCVSRSRASHVVSRERHWLLVWLPAQLWMVLSLVLVHWVGCASVREHEDDVPGGVPVKPRRAPASHSCLLRADRRAVLVATRLRIGEAR